MTDSIATTINHRPSLTRRSLLPLGGLALAAPLVGAQRAGAQTPAPTPGTEQWPPTITVTGEGRVNVTPDVATITVGVSIVNEDLDAAQQEASSIAQALIDTATANGVEEDDIQTESFDISIREEYDRNGNPTGERSFEVSNMISVRLRDLDAAGTVLGELVAAGANRVYGISFSVADPGPATAEARTAAATDARERAEAYAAGLGVEITGVLAVEEMSAPQPMARETEYATAEDSVGAAPAVPVAAGSTAISVTIQAMFEISG
ncbi:MAG TPA: SIMPL domain-containing protein [Thermomicrobiales bacterium]|jgi:hypothetical protein|nr:SIMPL domain-containing protein [Thermomicrobiales bacterium]